MQDAWLDEAVLSMFTHHFKNYQKVGANAIIMVSLLNIKIKDQKWWSELNELEKLVEVDKSFRRLAKPRWIRGEGNKKIKIDKKLEFVKRSRGERFYTTVGSIPKVMKPSKAKFRFMY